MPPRPRNLQPGYCYHITIRCNNRGFNLAQRQCREVLLCCIKKAIYKYEFKLYALCIMSNHIQYLIEPAQPENLPKIMHFINWYAAISPLLRRVRGMNAEAYGTFLGEEILQRGFPHRRCRMSLKYFALHPCQPTQQQKCDRVFFMSSAIMELTSV